MDTHKLMLMVATHQSEKIKELEIIKSMTKNTEEKKKLDEGIKNAEITERKCLQNAIDLEKERIN